MDICEVFPVVCRALPFLDEQEELAEKYPDLGKDDLALVENYLKAYDSRDSQANRYLDARSKVLSRMGQLQVKFEDSGGDRQKRLQILAKLVNFNQIMRETRVAPVYFDSGIFHEQSVFLPQCGGEGLSTDIPEDVKVALDLNFSKLSFIDYVGLHVRQAIFVPRLREHVKILNSDRWTGTCEETTRSIIIDSYDDKRGRPFEAWKLAAAAVHEAAHIDYFHRFASDPKAQELDRAERFAYIVENAYLSSLFLKVKDDKCVPEKTREEIALAFYSVLQQIAILNQRLGLDPKNYDLAKY